MTLLLVLQLLAFPVTQGYAKQVKNDVVVSITFPGERPTKVCTYVYAVDDVEMVRDIDRPHCWTPKTDIGSLDVWPNMRLDEGNWKVVLTYARRPTETFPLFTKVDS